MVAFIFGNLYPRMIYLSSPLFPAPQSCFTERLRILPRFTCSKLAEVEERALRGAGCSPEQEEGKCKGTGETNTLGRSEERPEKEVFGGDDEGTHRPCQV